MMDVSSDLSPDSPQKMNELSGPDRRALKSALRKVALIALQTDGGFISAYPANRFKAKVQ